MCESAELLATTAEDAPTPAHEGVHVGPVVFSMTDADEDSWWGSSSQEPANLYEAWFEARERMSEAVAERNMLHSQLAAEHAKCVAPRHQDRHTEPFEVAPAMSGRLPPNSLESKLQHTVAGPISFGSDCLELKMKLAAFIAHSRRRLQEQCEHLDELEGHATLPLMKVPPPAVATAPDWPLQSTDCPPVESAGVEQVRQALAKAYAQLRCEEERRLAARKEASTAFRNLETCQSKLAAAKDEIHRLELRVEELRGKLEAAEVPARGKVDVPNETGSYCNTMTQILPGAKVDKQSNMDAAVEVDDRRISCCDSLEPPRIEAVRFRRTLEITAKRDQRGSQVWNGAGTGDAPSATDEQVGFTKSVVPVPLTCQQKCVWSCGQMADEPIRFVLRRLASSPVLRRSCLIYLLVLHMLLMPTVLTPCENGALARALSEVAPSLC